MFEQIKAFLVRLAAALEAIKSAQFTLAQATEIRDALKLAAEKAEALAGGGTPPDGGGDPVLVSVTLPVNILGLATVGGFITFGGPAIVTTDVFLLSDNPILTVPGSTAVIAGQTNAVFNAVAGNPTAPITVKITAKAGSIEKSVTVTVNPNP